MEKKEQGKRKKLNMDEFLEYWNKKEWPMDHDVSHLMGRICKGRNEDEFETFTDYPSDIDRTAFLLGEDGLKELMEANAKGGILEMCHSIGFTKDYIHKKKSTQLESLVSRILEEKLLTVEIANVLMKKYKSDGL